MKITKSQLAKLIRDAVAEELSDECHADECHSDEDLMCDEDEMVADADGLDAIGEVQTLNDYTRNMISTLYEKAKSGSDKEAKSAAAKALKYAENVVEKLKALA